MWSLADRELRVFHLKPVQFDPRRSFFFQGREPSKIIKDSLEAYREIVTLTFFFFAISTPLQRALDIFTTSIWHMWAGESHVPKLRGAKSSERLRLDSKCIGTSGAGIHNLNLLVECFTIATLHYSNRVYIILDIGRSQISVTRRKIVLRSSLYDAFREKII